MCNGEATLEFSRGGGGSSERWEGASAKVTNAVLAFALPLGSALVVRSDEPLHLRENTRRPSSKCAPVLFMIISCFS